ncbi:MAG: YARHG domain-containing protein [Alphaproteobacteria bacterium]|nr:YARHG domain-containing protein [Alphaproteobacteria bacterium]
MPDATTRALADRVRDIADHVRRAHDAYDAGDAAGCGWRARTATEGMLSVLCVVHAVEAPDGPGKATIEVLRKQLRHARVLDRAMEDHVAHIQNIGNRAAHAQHADHAVDLHDAASLLPALDRTWQRFGQLLPEPLAAATVHLDDPATSPARMAAALATDVDTREPDAVPWWRDLLVWGGALLALPVAFLVTTAVLRTLDPAPALPATPPVAPPLIDAAAMEADLDGAPSIVADAAPPSDPADPALQIPPRVDDLLADVDVGTVALPPLAQAITTVRSPALLRRSELAPLDCTDLQWTRAWIWARHGYVFGSDVAQRWFARQEGYVRASSANRREIERAFDDVDTANLDLLNARMIEDGCPCPLRTKKKAPCPD